VSIRFVSVGGAGTVTGSRHLVHTPRATILLECGLFQGRRAESRERNRRLGLDPSKIDAVVLSHAHIDHSGAVPLLCKEGYRRTIYATPATRDLSAAMLADAASIQAADARYLNRRILREGLDAELVEPLYDGDDVAQALGKMHGVPYRQSVPIADGVRLTFLDAGHVLGSAIVALDVEDGGHVRRVVFTGDLGRHHLPILGDPEIPDGATALITESTYGDRLHPPIAAMDDELAAVVTRTIGRGGKIIIPSFALERAQEVVYALKGLRRAGRIPLVPVYVDSPLASNLTQVFRLHPECYDADARAALAGGDSPFEFDGLRYVASVEESVALTHSADPAIVIAAGGMCEGGRVLHHLKAIVEEPRHTVAVVGFMAPHTLGRRLVEKRDRVRIFGVERHRACDVVALDGFSAHADQADLVGFAEAVRSRGALGPVILVHGEPGPQAVLRDRLVERGFGPVDIAVPHEELEL
jgi:metallo-beta-lactamase family protein